MDLISGLKSVEACYGNVGVLKSTFWPAIA